MLPSMHWTIPTWAHYVVVGFFVVCLVISLGNFKR